jgi:hypothetical protein
MPFIPAGVAEVFFGDAYLINRYSLHTLMANDKQQRIEDINIFDVHF